MVADRGDAGLQSAFAVARLTLAECRTSAVAAGWAPLHA